MEYLVLNAECAGELEARVRTKIKEGFEPIGGASAACYPAGVVLIQSLIRKPNANLTGKQKPEKEVDHV